MEEEVENLSQPEASVVDTNVYGSDVCLKNLYCRLRVSNSRANNPPMRSPEQIVLRLANDSRHIGTFQAL